MGVIGAGERALALAETWHQPEGQSVIVAAADPNRTMLDTFAREVNPDVEKFDQYEALLRRDDVEAVAITSPDYCHEEQAIAAFEAGKHVFCEKPLAITIEGCDRILDAWKKSGKQLMVGFNMRYMNMFQTIKEIIDSGTIGEIKAVWVRHFVGRGGYYYYHDWHGLRANTTSLLLQKGSHDIDLIHWLTGKYTKKVAAFGSMDLYGGDKPNDLTCPTCPEKDTCPEASFDRLIQCAFRQELDVEDNQVVIMELEGGIKATYMECHFTPDYHRNFTFIGTEGRIENSQPDGKVYVWTRKSSSLRELSNRVYDIKPAEGGHDGADPFVCRDFIRSILSGEPPLSDPISGRMSVAAGVRATESMRSGGQVLEVPGLPEYPASAGKEAHMA